MVAAAYDEPRGRSPARGPGMSASRGRWPLRAAVIGTVATLLAGIGTLGTAPSGTSQETSGSAATVTKTVQRIFVEDGTERVVDERRVTVRVDKTRELRGRQRISVSWSGAHPSAARAANPYGELGLAQEYPVVLLQCRGVDDPNVPTAQQVSPETCWTSSRAQRSQSAVERAAVWRSDLHATDADREPRAGMNPFPDPETCTDAGVLSTRLTPFRAVDGTVFPACSSDTMPPEAAVGAAFPPAEQAAFTDLDGNGSAAFEVRTAVENESLGCSDRVDCTLVVIPIMGLSCVEGAAECRKEGRFVAGSSNFANEGVDAAVSPAYWWSASNWRNRISIPLTFGLAPDACDVLDTRAPTGFYGSELLSQAALQWSPAFCLRKDRFKFQHNRMADEAAFALMSKGEAVAALVSSEHDADTPVAYAPTAVTGFGIAFVADLPDNAGELTTLRLNARLLAKLLTQSYPGSALGQQHPGMARNPLSMNLDPEFIALNPGLDRTPREAMATLLSLSEASDVMGALTSYIASDPEAKAFVDGKPDKWGMRVNPTYKAIALPIDEWPLLDTFIPQTQQECLIANPSPYLGRLAAPVTSLRKIAEAVLDSWPNVQTRCDRPTPDEPFKVGRVDRQGIGSRMMLGIVSLGDAARFGLRTAALETASNRYVAPTPASLRATVELAEQKRVGRPFTWTPAQVRRARTAYPGMQVVYTAARTRGMSKADAAKVVQFIRVSLAEGQRPGPGNGQLPDGYLPIQATGATAKLHAAALRVAEVVAAQSGGPRKRTAEEEPGQQQPSPTPQGAPPAAGPDTPDAPPENPVAAPDIVAGGEEQVLLTTAVTSGVAGSLLPVLLAVVALAALTSVGLQVAMRLPRRGRR